MSILALATLLFLSNSPSPTEIRDDHLLASRRVFTHHFPARA